MLASAVLEEKHLLVDLISAEGWEVASGLQAPNKFNQLVGLQRSEQVEEDLVLHNSTCRYKKEILINE